MSDAYSVEWEWRKKDYSKSEIRQLPVQFYYVLNNDGLKVTLAWECVPT